MIAHDLLKFALAIDLIFPGPISSLIEQPVIEFIFMQIADIGILFSQMPYPFGYPFDDMTFIMIGFEALQTGYGLAIGIEERICPDSRSIAFFAFSAEGFYLLSSSHRLPHASIDVRPFYVRLRSRQRIGHQCDSLGAIKRNIMDKQRRKCIEIIPMFLASPLYLLIRLVQFMQSMECFMPGMSCQD
jgi:hypothetical protein